MKKFWIVLGCVVGLPIVAFILFATYIGTVGPDIMVVPGQKVMSNHKKTINKLGLLEPGETIEYFYSDALTDVKDGMYMVTNKHLIVYSDYLSPPKNIIPFSEIQDIGFERDTSFWTDSEVTITIANEEELYFPLSTENSGDKKFIQRLKEKTDLENKEEESDEEDLPEDN